MKRPLVNLKNIIDPSPTFRRATEACYLYMRATGKSPSFEGERSLLGLADIWPSPPRTVGEWPALLAPLAGRTLRLCALTFTDGRIGYLTLRDSHEEFLCCPDISQIAELAAAVTPDCPTPDLLRILDFLLARNGIAATTNFPGKLIAPQG